MSKDLVVKANALIEAGYQLTTNEQRLILSAIACIPKGEPIDPNVGYCVSKRNFVNLGVNPKTANREIREACDRLFSRYVTIKTEQGEFKTRWVQDIMKYDKDWAEYNREFFIETIGEDPDEDDCILAAITFSRSVIPYLTELKSNFTQYMLSDVKGFSSAYSFRIFEFMMQFKATGFIKIGLKEFRQRLDLGDKYPATKDLRVYVIDTAIKEINEKSPYTAKYDLLKTGRKITHLELRFKPKAKAIEHKIERDPDTIDWVNGVTDKEIKLLSQKQADYFASKIANNTNFGSKFARIGEDPQPFISRISNELQRDISKVASYMPYLISEGYSPTN
ncbi:RepB family plasmid replication initiator protein [bacterium M00.F.Ca.ET.230.01.1.1]|nr:RepB family plasmid replication initiator protein [bacterium M00.F.Ca.ET.230.01.1.1]